MPAAVRLHTPLVPTNSELAFADRPDVQVAWVRAVEAIKRRTDMLRYELTTLAAARRLRSSYRCLAHGTVLLGRFGERVRGVALDHRSAGLGEADVAVIDLAERVADDSTSITGDDPSRLRSLRRTEAAILDVVLTAAARCFFAKTLDAPGAVRDASYARLDPALREALVVGRPIAGS